MPFFCSRAKRNRAGALLSSHFDPVVWEFAVAGRSGFCMVGFHGATCNRIYRWSLALSEADYGRQVNRSKRLKTTACIRANRFVSDDDSSLSQQTISRHLFVLLSSPN